MTATVRIDPQHHVNCWTGRVDGQAANHASLQAPHTIAHATQAGAKQYVLLEAVPPR
jgi:hypothetical protein